MFQKSWLFNVISFCSSLEKVMHACSAYRNSNWNERGSFGNSKKTPGYPTTRLSHDIKILCTFNLSHVSTEIANSLKPMENHQKLQLWVNLFWTKVQNFNLNFFKGIQNVSKILSLFLEQLTFCGETLLVGLILIKITTVQPLKQPVGIVMIVMRNGWPTKGIKPYLQSRPMSQILTIANLWHARSRIRACAELQALLKEVAQ